MKPSPVMLKGLGVVLSVALGVMLLAAVAQNPPDDGRQVRGDRPSVPERPSRRENRPRSDRPDGRRPGRIDPGVADCTNTSVGLTPITDLRSGTYKGFEGGLYENGRNVPPAAHEEAGAALAQQIRPLSRNGTPDPNGRYVLLSIGMSNTVTEFTEFSKLANADPDKDKQLVVVNGAQGGVAANAWADPSNPAWGVVGQQLAAAGVTPEQVAVAWVKVADQVSLASGIPPFPEFAQGLQARMEAVARLLHDRYPNLRLAYYSSRSYGGYSDNGRGNPEPFAYQSGFSVKWLIEAQIDGRPELNFDPAKGPVEAPWLAWGPYLWADGLTSRSDGLTWDCSEFQLDGIHPGSRGAAKVATMLLEFMKADPTAAEWFTESGEPSRS